MNTLSTTIIVFVVLESLNILILYFAPQSKKGNGIGVFNAYEKSKSDPEVHQFINYLINWIAGSKIIFVALLIVVAFFSDERIQLYCLLALIISISTFFWRLYPIIKNIDQDKQLSPKGYSKTLAVMIATFLIAFIVVLCGYLF